jgi:Domain of unknown function (DUF4126)
MNFSGIISSVGSIGPFSTRIFLPALVMALLLRFGVHMPILDHLGLLKEAARYPTWFTSNTCIAVLAALTVLEVFAQKNPEARRVLNEIDIYIKPVAAALCALGVLSATDNNTVGLLSHQAGVMDAIPPILAAVGTFAVARVRRDVVNLVLDHIEGTHLDRLLSWGEDGFVIVGVFAWVIIPTLMLIFIGIVTVILTLWRKRLEKIEEQSRVPCAHCGASIFPSAMSCFSCRTAVAEPKSVGFLGQSTPDPDLDLEHHPLRLVEKRRCAVCATHLKHGGVGQKCTACGAVFFADEEFAQRYANFIAMRLPTVLGVSFLLGLVPFLGLIAGAVYYRMMLVLPFNEYLPMGRRFGLRIGLRILFFLLVVFQLIPLVGGLVVPLMALLTYTAYRASFQSYIAKLHAAEPLPGGNAGAAVPAV